MRMAVYIGFKKGQCTTGQLMIPIPHVRPQGIWSLVLSVAICTKMKL